MSTCYTVRDGDMAEEVAREGTVRMGEWTGFCEVCDCYRTNRTWQVLRLRGIPYHVCPRHAPEDVVRWKETR